MYQKSFKATHQLVELNRCNEQLTHENNWLGGELHELGWCPQSPWSGVGKRGINEVVCPNRSPLTPSTHNVAPFHKGKRERQINHDWQNSRFIEATSQGRYVVSPPHHSSRPSLRRRHPWDLESPSWTCWLG